MKRTVFNSISSGASGSFMDQVVLRTSKDGTQTLAKVPAQKTGPVHPKMQENMDRFQQAADYANAVKRVPQWKNRYEEVLGFGVNVYKAAMKDFLTPPTVGPVNNVDYTGSPGGELMVVIKDDVKVKSAGFELFTANGDLIESSPAEERDQDSWWYVATQPNATLTGTKLVVTAKDLPGNVTVKEMVL